MRAGRRDTLIQFQRRSSANPDVWTDDFQEWVEAIRLSEMSARFTLLYRQNPDGSELSAATHRLLWKGAYWNIVDATPNDRERELVLTSDRGELIAVTHLQSTTTEYLDGVPDIRPRIP